MRATEGSWGRNLGRTWAVEVGADAGTGGAEVVGAAAAGVDAEEGADVDAAAGRGWSGREPEAALHAEADEGWAQVSDERAASQGRDRDRDQALRVGSAASCGGTGPAKVLGQDRGTARVWPGPRNHWAGPESPIASTAAEWNRRVTEGLD